MIVQDQRPFQHRIHALLDDTRGRLTNIVPFRRAVAEAVREHRIPIDAEHFAGRLSSLVIGGNRPRAHEVVDELGEEGFTLAGEVLCMLWRIVNRTLVLLFVIVFVSRCGLAIWEAT